MFVPLEGSDKEPIGARIIEVPEHPDRTELRDPRSGFIAYVPTGSLARGEALVMTGAGKTTACGICHGIDLKGLGPVPGLAGRSPSYTARQMTRPEKSEQMRCTPWREITQGAPDGPTQ